MINVNLIINSNNVLSVRVPLPRLSETLTTLGNSVTNMYEVLSSTNKVPTINDPNGEFVFNCVDGTIVKLTTSLS